MAGGPSSQEFVAVASAAGVLGSAGAAYSSLMEIENFAAQVRQCTNRPFAINLVPTRSRRLIRHDRAGDRSVSRRAWPAFRAVVGAI
jgi:NAD(P)H-dependent flavin oxidoreductase YrpB (nitropropane dioxygenase family)